MHQPPLFEFRMGERSPDTLVVAESNRDAARLLTDWRNWPGGALALTGPAGSGKTHLALAWALETGARQLSASASPGEGAQAFHEAQGRLLIDQAGGARDEDMLWRVLDLAKARGGAVLLVGETAPSAWRVGLPDLRSRLAALPVARLGEPDDALMEVVLRRMCRERFIQLSDEAVRFLTPRLPRTFAAARNWLEALEHELAGAEKRISAAKPVSLKLARKAYESARAGWAEAGDG